MKILIEVDGIAEFLQEQIEKQEIPCPEHPENEVFLTYNQGQVVCNLVSCDYKEELELTTPSYSSELAEVFDHVIFQLESAYINKRGKANSKYLIEGYHNAVNDALGILHETIPAMQSYCEGMWDEIATYEFMEVSD